MSNLSTAFSTETAEVIKQIDGRPLNVWQSVCALSVIATAGGSYWA